MIRRGTLPGLLTLALLLGAGWGAAGRPAAAAEPAKAVAVGDKVPQSNSLRDLRGTRRPLHDFKGYKAVVVAFLGADCPNSNLYLPGLIALEKKYRDQQVQFLAVYPND